MLRASEAEQTPRVEFIEYSVSEIHAAPVDGEGSEATLICLQARNTGLHQHVIHQCEMENMQLQDFINVALEEVDRQRKTTSAEETAWIQNWNKSVTKIKSIYD